MQSMLLLIPVLVFLGLGGLLLRRGRAQGIGDAFLRALVLWGVIACLLIEILSPFHAITRAGLAISWLLVGAGVGALLLPSRGSRQPILAGVHLPEVPQSAAGRFSLGVVVLVLVLTGVVAWQTPPQTWDSLNYHVPRVAHWTQQASVEHFATGIEVQNSRPPGAEYLQLHVYVLSGGDQFLPLLNWVEFLIAIIAAGLIGKRLVPGSGLLAMACAATIPMAIIQASSTVNDLMVGIWTLAFAWEVIRIRSEPPSLRDGVFLGGAAGLALLTKPTAFAYLFPLTVWAILLIIRRVSSEQWLRLGLAVGLLIAGLNLPYLLRNQRTYGSPFDPAQVEIHSNQSHSPAVLVSNTLRNLALNASTPIPAANKAVFLAIVHVHNWMGISPNDPRTTAHEPFRVHSFSTHEERSGNAIHTLLVLALMVWLLRRRKDLPGDVKGLVLSSVTAFLILSYLFQWQVFGSRYQLPFFLLWAPILGYVLFGWPGWSRTAILGLLFVGSLPWLLSIRSRPLLPIPGQVSAPSVLTGSRQTLYFTNGEYLERPYSDLTSLIKDQDCKAVGLSISGSSAEYLLWELMGVPQSGAELEWIVANTPSARYLRQNFEPCAVICEDCAGGQAAYRGLTVSRQIGTYTLFTP